MTQQEKDIIHLSDYTQTPYDIQSIALEIEFEEDATTVRSNCHFVRRNGVQDSLLSLDGRNLELVSIKLNDRPLTNKDYSISDSKLEITDAPEDFNLEVITKIKPHENFSLEGVYKSQGNFCTQCEAEGFRNITYFYDRPDIMTCYKVKLIADKTKYPVLLSNGNCIDQGQLSNNRHFTLWDDPFPKPCYLFALVAGDFNKITSHYKTISNRDIKLEIYAKDQDIEKCEHAMESLKRSMKWDEDVFGLECDLDEYKIVAISDFNMGAMENKGLNIFNTALVLANPNTATDASYNSIEAVIGHEYFHNWTGNRVTCRDWFQLCLKEGLTVFRDQEFSSDMGSRSVVRINEVLGLKLRQWPEDDGPMAHPPRPNKYIEINNFYTSTVYNKGAEVVRMLQTIIGKENFRKGMDLYFKKFDGQAITQEDFVGSMAEASSQNLDQFMLWYTQAGTPTVKVSTQYNSENQSLAIEFSQSYSNAKLEQENKPVVIPVTMSLLDETGNAIALHLEHETGDGQKGATERTFCLNQKSQTLTFTGVKADTTASLFRNFSAAVKVDYEQSVSELAFLSIHDNDPYNCWDAAQKLYSRTLLNLVEQIQQEQKQLNIDPLVFDAFSAILTNEDFDPAFKALALTLPSQNIIAQEMKIIDVDAIYEAHTHLKKELGLKFYAVLDETYKSVNDTSPYEPNPKQMGRRSLKNCCLSYLNTSQHEDALNLTLEQLHKGHNFTDVSAALSCLSNSDSQEKAQEFSKFYQDWEQDSLVIDRWFSIQAQTQNPKNLEQINYLLKHKAFTLKNPNRLRSVLGVLAFANPSLFHLKNGKGYQLIGEYVIKLNNINRQMASYLARAFEQWKRYDIERQALMKKQLELIINEPGISPDVYEVVSKALQ